MSDDVIYFDDEDNESDDSSNDDEEDVLDIVDEEIISVLIDEMRESIDTIEDIVMNLYYANLEAQEHYAEVINKLNSENNEYREEIKKLYQELASKSKKEE
jgi:hypothetical protein